MEDSEKRARAEARLEAALVERGLEDPRPAYRERLRSLRETHPAAFDQALGYYEASTIVDLAGTADPVDTWVEYGRVIGELTGPGALVAIDTDGRATPYAPPLPPRTMVLHIPEDTSNPILAAAVPRDASAAQRAAHGMLVERQLSL